MPNSAALRRSTSTCLARDRVGDRLVDVGGGDVVVLGGDGEVGPAHGAAGQAQAVEGLRAGHLVDEVEVDVEQVGLARRRRGRRGGPRPSRPASWVRPCVMVAVSLSETLISSRGHDCKRRRRARQGGGRARRPGPGAAAARPGRAGGGDGAAPGDGLPPRRGARGARARAPRRRRPLRARACGWSVWGGRRPSAFPLAEAARPVLERLRDETGESVQLYVRSGDRRGCASSRSSRPTACARSCPSARCCPLDRGSAGRVLSGAPAARWASRSRSARRGWRRCRPPCATGPAPWWRRSACRGRSSGSTRAPARRYGDAVHGGGARHRGRPIRGRP